MDLAGISIFNACGEGGAPRLGLVFSAPGKPSFGFHDKPNSALKRDAVEKLKSYRQVWQSPEKGIENLLVRQVPIAVVHRFLNEVKDRSDYPSEQGTYDPNANEAHVTALAVNVLKARKGDGYGYAALPVACCEKAAELPATIREILDTIHKELSAVPEEIAAPPPEAFGNLANVT